MVKMLVDCTPLTAGGGVQVGISVVQNAIRQQGVETFVVASEEFLRQLELDRNLREKLTCGENLFVVRKKSFLEKLSSPIKLSSIERKIAPDIVFTVFGPSYWKPKAVSLQGFALGKMLYPESRRSYRSKVTRLKEEFGDLIKKRLFLRNADFYIVETSVVRDRLSKFFGVSGKNIFVVGNSFSKDFQLRYEKVEAGREKKKFSKFSFFAPASFYHHKNLEVLPSVAEALKACGLHDFDFTLTLDETSEGWKRIMDLAAEKLVEEHFRTVGVVPNKYIADCYYDCDVVVCTSLIESSTAVFPEAFMSKRPLAVSDRDFSRQLCGPAAMYFDPHRPDDIASKLIEIINDAHLCHRHVEKGSEQLKLMYPSPEEKWDQQYAVIKRLAGNV